MARWTVAEMDEREGLTILKDDFSTAVSLFRWPAMMKSLLFETLATLLFSLDLRMTRKPQSDDLERELTALSLEGCIRF
jgi:hypothetical protein